VNHRVAAIFDLSNRKKIPGFPYRSFFEVGTIFTIMFKLFGLNKFQVPVFCFANCTLFEKIGFMNSISYCFLRATGNNFKEFEVLRT